MKRKYHEKVIDDAFNRLNNIEREAALMKVERRKNKNRPVLAVTYDPRQPAIPAIVAAAYKSASADPTFKKTFPEKPLIAFRKQKTVGDHLIRAILHPKPRGGVQTREPKPGFRKCGRNGGSGCILCHYSTPSTTHTASATGETFPITSVITCTTKNVIYDLWCNKG